MNIAASSLDEADTARVHVEKAKEFDESFNKEYKEHIEEFHKTDKSGKKEKYVRCKLCISLPNIVKLHSDNNKVAPIATTEGIRYRYRYVSEHFHSKYHNACKMSLNVPSNTIASIDFHVSKKNAEMVSHVLKILFQLYVDAKKLTCSAHSWPARFVGAEAGQLFDVEKPNEKMFR